MTHSPFEFPEAPPDGAPMQDTLRFAIGVLGQSLRTAEPLSLRMKVLVAIQRFAQKGIDLLDHVESDGDALRTALIVLEVRDLARRVQDLILGYLSEETVSEDAAPGLALFRVKLAQVEQAAMMVLAVVGSDRQEDEDASWWAGRAGKTIANVLVDVAPLLQLPEDSAWYAAFRATGGAMESE